MSQLKPMHEAGAQVVVRISGLGGWVRGTVVSATRGSKGVIYVVKTSYGTDNYPSARVRLAPRRADVERAEAQDRYDERMRLREDAKRLREEVLRAAEKPVVTVADIRRVYEAGGPIHGRADVGILLAEIARLERDANAEEAALHKVADDDEERR